jgi:hypothetical protein
MFATPAATPVGCRRLRTLVSALTVAALCAGWLAAPAGATTLSATCLSLGNQLTAANPGDTIVLSGMCTSPNATFTLPATANLTIEGAPTGTNGFDGTGVSTPALTTGEGNINGITLENLTFQNYHSSSAVHLQNTGATGSSPFTFSHDTFTGDGSNTQGLGVHGGGLFLHSQPTTCAFPSSSEATLTDSTFTNDLADPSGGGAMIELGCLNAVTPTASVTGNAFSNDHVTDTMSGADGGGLYVDGNLLTISLTQQDNIFESDSVTGAAADLAGGGEYAVGANITSVGDQFINDSLSGPSNNNTWSWGAGLALFTQLTACTPVTSQFTDLVAAGNSIGAPTDSATGADVAGGGIYADGICPKTGYNLTLVDSTVSGNMVTGTGAVAGVSGQTNDALTLQNTIVDGDSGGAELGGFGATTGASVTATDSDVCAVGSTSVAFAGTGNICAAPALAGAGTGDAHETAASPTIDAGSSALVPAGVSTDVYGNPRIVPRVGGGTALVDIGAAELPSTAPPVTTPVNTSPPVVTGTVDVGDTLSCSTGTWTGAPTSFTYTWSRDGTPIAGATHSTYAVLSIDQGRRLTCTVSAANAAGAAAGVASRQVSVAAARCSAATGLLHGRRLGLITLGDSRAQAAKGYLHASTRHRRHEEFFCLTPIGVRVGYAAPGVVRTLSSHQRAALRGRVIWISTANRFYALDGVRPGATLRTARRGLKLGAVFSVGHNDWYFARGAAANGLIKVRRGIVQEIGIVTKLLTNARRAQGRFLRSFG